MTQILIRSTCGFLRIWLNLLNRCTERKEYEFRIFSLYYYSTGSTSQIKVDFLNERLKFAAAYWVSSAEVEATGVKLFLAEGMHKYDSIQITPLLRRDGI